MESRTVDLEGPVHVADYGGEGPVLVLVHGLGGSHLNWSSVASALAQHHRVLAVDLIGFGETPPAGRRSTLSANQRLLERFLREEVKQKATLVGNSMGGLLSMRVAAASPEWVEGLVLVNPAFPRRLWGVDRRVFALFAVAAVPLFAERLIRWRNARLSPERAMEEMFAIACRDPASIAPEAVAAHLAFAQARPDRPWEEESFLQACRSLLLALARRGEMDGVARAVRAPTLLISGAHDRLIPAQAIERVARLRPDWTHLALPHTGHLPMLEDPAGFVTEVERWLSQALSPAPRRLSS